MVRPEARFLWGRITPGGLGLEFTALLAAFAVALYVLIVYTVIVSGDPGPTGADHAAMDVAEQLRATGLNEIVKAFTYLGSAAVVLPLTLVIAVMLAIERRWADVAVLVGRDADNRRRDRRDQGEVGRPRRSGGLVGYGNQAFPSAHASYSTIYAALAVAIVVRLRPGLTNATAIVLCGIALTAAVGLSRVYLGVHYLSDVSAGWALGVAAFSGCAGVAVVASHLRQNGAVTVLAKIAPEYLLFGGAGLVSLLAFTLLILVPAISSYGRAWEKATAAALSLFVLAALVLIGVAAGVAIVYFWDDIGGWFG